MVSLHDLQFVAPERLIEGWDISRTSLGRLEKSGLLRPFYLYSRKLYRLEDVRRLEGMIERGELRAALRGAASMSHAKRGGLATPDAKMRSQLKNKLNRSLKVNLR